MDIRKLTAEELLNSLNLIGVDIEQGDDIFVKAYENFIKFEPGATPRTINGAKLPTPICDLYIATTIFPYSGKIDPINVDSLTSEIFLGLCKKLFLPAQDNRLTRLRAQRIIRITQDFSTCSYFSFLPTYYNS